ncbi:MAG TPA: L-idonate 5-dehydrogenase [Burkholderiales bacterium]|nr:L-idonate 5-dehydrogenase [Burkholderiales bacterium]
MRSAMLFGPRDLRIVETPDPAPPPPGMVKLRFGAGGICGSDLSYYGKFKVGDFDVREPIVLGHEVAGEVVETGAGVTRVKAGDRVAVNPNQPCRVCRTCVAGQGNLCLQMNFYGSAAVYPHIQGVFREYIVCSEAQCFAVPGGLDFRIAAMAEPLAVTMHAVNRAGSLLGKHLLITGCGPIGCLTLMVARRAGAASITVTDLSDAALARALKLGADRAVNSATQADQVEAWYANKGTFDISIECSGSSPGMNTAILATASGGRVVQVGMMGETPVPINRLMSREVDYVGAFRFDREYAWAVAELANGRIDVAPLLTHSYRMEKANDAFVVAADRSQSMKVHLTL